MTTENERADEEFALWRCEQCGKWSHAQRRPKQHQRFLSADKHREPAEFVSYEPQWSSEFDDGNAGGWWVMCGPFAEFVARRSGVSQ